MRQRRGPETLTAISNVVLWLDKAPESVEEGEADTECFTWSNAMDVTTPSPELAVPLVGVCVLVSLLLDLVLPEVSLGAVMEAVLVVEVPELVPVVVVVVFVLVSVVVVPVVAVLEVGRIASTEE